MTIDTAAILAARYHKNSAPLKAAVLGQGDANINPYAALRALQLQKEAERYEMAQAADSAPDATADATTADATTADATTADATTSNATANAAASRSSGDAAGSTATAKSGSGGYACARRRIRWGRHRSFCR